jgi:4-hydroxybenzoate polyprenyltransferase
MVLIYKLFRIKQWTKNVFVLAAFVFTKGWKVEQSIVATILAFFAMCFISSSTYIVNDIFDVEKDRKHPVKKNRPIASGKITVTTAAIIAASLFVLSFVFGYIADPKVPYGIGAYVLLQIAYNLYLRNKSIADVFCIALGFVIRVVVGAQALSAQLSGWILLCTATLALMLGFGKRRHEWHLQGGERRVSRRSLANYSELSLDMLVVFSATCAVLTYSVYSIESQTARQYPALILTTPFVIYGIARYLVVVFGEGETGEPESLVLKDRHLIASFVCFAVAAVLALKGLQLPFLFK